MSQMLRLATRVPGLSDPPSMRKVYRLGQGEPDRMTPARRKVIETLVEYGGLGFTLSELSSLAGVSTSVIKGLAAQGVVEEADTPRDTPYLPLDPDRPGKDLAEDQAAAAEVLRGAIRTGAYGTTLLKGVTGSGKTEVYLEAVAECLRKGRQALVLLPEIALTAEFLTRVEARFGAKPAEWHSGVTMTERRRCWKMAGRGRRSSWSARGRRCSCRSATSVSSSSMRSTTVPTSRKTGVLYNARDMAVLRASLNEAQVVLASATPSLETWANAEAGKYARLDLTSRFGPAVLPEMAAIDMRAGGPAGAIVDFADAGLGGRGAGAGGGTGAPVPQPPRLCAGDTLPGLRGTDRLRSLRCADGGAPVPQTPRLPPVRRDQTPARDLPGLRGGGQDGRRRPRRGARG
jgi:primosomal protein N' (replication factor Y)